ncbi:hypothetical protein COCON_G00066820 [Conger conger]|uniref:Cystatin fetuin-B-type domain-containing protein n=1 Tax=Conger conger TaxID=82655 RepID=A0A9Q1DSK4_CONCO|nr:histidine-rich glycoprotein-like [Conger conger]KAJ8279616.1 hypothetical protein COCON_G00066820 [Conger conger]
MLRCGLLLLLAFVCINGAPVNSSLEPGNCQDPFTQSAAEQALDRINRDRRQGYVFAPHRLNSAHHTKHGPTGVVFYLILDVQETKCHVLSKRVWKSCEVRQESETPVYGQCSAIIYINKVKRIVQLYSYNCSVRSVPSSRIVTVCPDCPTTVSNDEEGVLTTVKMAMEKYNRESGNANYFASLDITKASYQGGIAEFWFADFTIQETACSNGTDVAQAAKCALMDCEFAHKGHCTASHILAEQSITIECEIFEPEGAEKEKQRHLLGGEHDHSHNDTQDHTHGEAHEHDHTHGHGQIHYHTHEHDHAHHHDNHAHTHNNDHTHDHAHEHDKANNHTHNHTHDQEHTHEHADDHAHNSTHDHSHDHIHYYGDHHHHHHHHHHGNHTHAHEHFHDHMHNHTHLHPHEHHHHHHDHDQGKTVKGSLGSVRYLPDLDRPVTQPSFPDRPELERLVIMPSFPKEPAGPSQAVTLPAFPDTETPNQEDKPHILPFPTGDVPRSPQCLIKPKGKGGLYDDLLQQDPEFKPKATV